MVKETIFRTTASFNRDLNRGFLFYMFSLRLSGSKFLINVRRQIRVRKMFFMYVKFFIHKVSGDLHLFILYLKLLFRKFVTFVEGCSFIKTC